jgi:hypothetical protein
MGDLLQVAGARVADGKALGLIHDDISQVFDFITE